MEIRVLEAEDADMYRIFEICSLAFARNEPFFDVTYPNHWTEAGTFARCRKIQTLQEHRPGYNLSESD